MLKFSIDGVISSRFLLDGILLFPSSEGLTFLLNFSGGSPTCFCGLENLRFQFMTYVLKCTADIFHKNVQLPPVFHICVHI